MYEWQIETDYGYGHGWELTTTEESREDAMRTLQDYRDNQPEYAHRVRRVKVSNDA